MLKSDWHTFRCASIEYLNIYQLTFSFYTHFSVSLSNKYHLTQSQYHTLFNNIHLIKSNHISADMERKRTKRSSQKPFCSNSRSNIDTFSSFFLQTVVARRSESVSFIQKYIPIWKKLNWIYGKVNNHKK